MKRRCAAVGLANGTADGIKILGAGELTKKLTVSAHAFSASAKAKIEAKGGTCEIVGAKPAAPAQGLDRALLIHVSLHRQHLRNCFKIPELKSRILFTLGGAGDLPVDGVHRAFPVWMARR